MMPVLQHKNGGPCKCRGYTFPHRPAGGKCLATERGPFCGDCGKPADATRQDFGYGVTEYWGSVSNHSDVRTVSRCCEADLFDDASLTKPYHHED